MPDHIEPISAHPGLADWPAMMHDLEKRVEVLSDALEGVKLSMRRLVLAEPWVEEALSSHAPAPAEVALAETAEATQPYMYEPAPAYHFDEPPAAFEESAAVEYDDEAREAVRRAVEDSKTPTAPSDWREETADYVTEDKPEVSWVTVPDDGSAPEPLPTFDDLPDAPASEEEAREAVRRAVEQAKAEMNTSNAAASVPVDADEAAREAVRRTVEHAKGGMGFGWGAAMPRAPRNDEQPPADSRPVFVQPTVSAIEPRAEEPAATLEDEESAREAVRLAVEQAKAEMAIGGQLPGSEPLDDEEAAREAVRKAVMQARTEMATTGSLSEDV